MALTGADFLEAVTGVFDLDLAPDWEDLPEGLAVVLALAFGAAGTGLALTAVRALDFGVATDLAGVAVFLTLTAGFLDD